MHALSLQQQLGDKIKLLGIGANNTPFEVNLYRNKFGQRFPLVPDADMSAAKALGVTSTPTYLLVALTKDGNAQAPLVVHVWEGRMPGSADEFWESVKSKAKL